MVQIIEKKRTYEREINSTKRLENRILIYRNAGGFGDVLMHRMMFRDIKEQNPDCEITVALRERHMPLIWDHPYVDQVINIKTMNRAEYGKVYNTLGRAGTYEFLRVPFIDRHRSDIWASFMGVELTEHKGYINFTEEEIEFADNFLSGFKRPFIGISPVSAHKSKNVQSYKTQALIFKLSRIGTVFVFHHDPLDYEKSINVNVGTREWMAITNRMDVIVTVATSMFNLANLLHIPTVAIFGVEDLTIFGKYFPEMVSIQRTREDAEWPFCPCWNSLDCKLKERNKRGDYPPECLASVSVGEIYEKVAGLIL